MNFHKYQKLSRNIEANTIPFVNMVFLLLLFVVLASSFTGVSGININLPRVMTSDIAREESIIILVTSENVFYYNNHVVTLRELKDLFISFRGEKCSVLIKADRGSSMGRVVDIWDIARNSGMKRINIATD